MDGSKKRKTAAFEESDEVDETSKVIAINKEPLSNKKKPKPDHLGAEKNAFDSVDADLGREIPDEIAMNNVVSKSKYVSKSVTQKADTSTNALDKESISTTPLPSKRGPGFFSLHQFHPQKLEPNTNYQIRQQPHRSIPGAFLKFVGANDEPISIEMPLEIRGERLKPIEASLMMLYPTKTRRLLDATRRLKPGCLLQYDNKPQEPPTSKTSHHTLNRYADDLDKFLYTTAGGNPELAANIIKFLLKRKNMAEIKELLGPGYVQEKTKAELKKEQLKKEQQETNALIVQGVQDFLYTHRTTSNKRKHEQDAVDAVLTACCSANKRVLRSKRPLKKKKLGVMRATDGDGDADSEKSPPKPKQNQHAKMNKGENKEFPIAQVAARLGRSPEQLSMYRNEMTGKLFEPRKEMTREDYYNVNPMAACVVDFCHSTEASFFVTNNENAEYACKPIVSSVTGLQEEHRLRLWHEPTWEDRYAIFIRSSIYRDYLARERELQFTQGIGDGDGDGRIQAIDLQTFQKYSCKCTREFHPKGRDRKIKRPPKPAPAHRVDFQEGEAFFDFLSRGRYEYQE